MLFYVLQTNRPLIFIPSQPTIILIMLMSILIAIDKTTAITTTTHLGALSYRPSFFRRIFTVLPLPEPSSMEFLPWCSSCLCQV